MILEARAERLTEPYFLDLNKTVIEQELARRRDIRRAGPVAEHILRTMNVMGTKVS